MAHNIAVINGQNAISYLDATPWHGMGQNLLQRMRAATPDQYISIAMQAAQLDWHVASMPLYLADGSEVQGHKASVRLAADGTVAAQLGVVGDGYRHIQNAEACEVLQVLAREFGCVPAAAGALGNGSRCWMLMRLTDATITPLPGDDVRGYFLLHWDHTGNMTVQGLGTAVRVVCQNTLNLATNGRKAWIAVKHTASASARLDEAAGIVRKVMQAMQTTGETFASMAAKGLNAAQLRAYIDHVIPNTSAATTVAPTIAARRETVLQLVHAGKGADMANQLIDTTGGSASLWAAYNAVTEYFDHVRPAEASSEAGRLNAQASAVFGGNADIKAEALTVARQLVAA